MEWNLLHLACVYLYISYGCRENYNFGQIYRVFTIKDKTFLFGM